MHQNVAVGVAHIQEVSPGNRRVFGFAGRGNELCRVARDDDRRWWSWLLAFYNLFRVFDLCGIGFRRQCGDFFWHGRCNCPLALDVGCCVPGLGIGIQVVGFLLRVQQHRKRRVDNPHQVAFLFFFQPRFAVDRDKYSCLRHEYDDRRLSTDLARCIDSLLTNVQACQQPVQ